MTQRSTQAIESIVWPGSAESRLDSKRHFLTQLRDARMQTQSDAESFDQLLFVFERLGQFLRQKEGTLYKYAKKLIALASQSSLSNHNRKLQSGCHLDIMTLYDLVNDGRNYALHQGAKARHLAIRAIELALILEDALVNGDEPMNLVDEVMVRSPTQAELWQPISFVRQIMLTNSFSSLPVRGKEKWSYVTDSAVASYLRAVNRDDRKDLLINSLDVSGLCRTAVTIGPKTPIKDVSSLLQRVPIVLITTKGGKAVGRNELLGVVTAFDIL